jgi:hypothetical protein
MEETCKWTRVAELIWDTQCKHQIGTHKKWEPEEGRECMCCKKPVEVEREHVKESVRA